MALRTPQVFVTALGLVTVFAVPVGGYAEDVQLALGPHTRVTVGPEGTVAQVHRLLVQGRRYVTVTAPSAGPPGRCGAPLQRVTVWEQLADRSWMESLSDTWDVCTRTPGELRTVTVNVANGPEARVLLTTPHQAPAMGTLVRYPRSGDRFIGPHRERPLAVAPNETPRGVLAPAPTGDLRADLAPWRDREALVSTPRVRVWVGSEGRSLRFAAHLPADPGPGGVLTLVLAGTDARSDLLDTERDNHGRTLTLRCDGRSSPDAEVRCQRRDDGVDLEGRTDLGTMVWAQPTVATVAVYAQVGEGTARIASDPNYRLHPFTLPAPLEVLAGASPQARGLCASARFRAWVPPREAADATGIRAVTCGARCTSGDCGHNAVADAVTRLDLTRASEGLCVRFTGAGAEAVNTCGADGDRARLLGVLSPAGFTTVVALDRQVRDASGGAEVLRTEVWALVSPSAAWRRLWQGAERTSPAAPRLDASGTHPRFCTETAGCEVAESVTLAPADPGGPVTAGLARLGLSAGLRSPPRF